MKQVALDLAAFDECKRTRRRKTRESELGGVAPKVCSQTRRKLAKSKPSRTTFRPTSVSCGITERSLFCSIKGWTGVLMTEDSSPMYL